MAEVENGIDRFAVLFKRATSLPTLPHAATSLIRVINTGEASAVHLERIMVTDPMLCALVVRVAATHFAQCPPDSLRMAILRLGQKEIRSIAISLAVKRVLHEDIGGSFDVARYARHSLMVGFLARYLFARRQKLQPFHSQWTADEIFAAGILHEISVPLLARVAPSEYNRVEMLARRTGQTMRSAFSRIYRCELSELGGVVAQMWDLPTVFSDTMRNMHEPWRVPEEMVALSTLSYADYLAELFGTGLEDWEVPHEPVIEAELEVGISPEEQTMLRDIVNQHVEAMIGPMLEKSPRAA